MKFSSLDVSSGKSFSFPGNEDKSSFEPLQALLARSAVALKLKMLWKNQNGEEFCSSFTELFEGGFLEMSLIGYAETINLYEACFLLSERLFLAFLRCFLEFSFMFFCSSLKRDTMKPTGN
jgi:hypothetical protein